MHKYNVNMMHKYNVTYRFNMMVMVINVTYSVRLFFLLKICHKKIILTQNGCRPQCSTSQERKCNTVYDTINEQKVLLVS